MHHHIAVKQTCRCGRPAVGKKTGAPICAYCLEIERSHWWHNHMEGRPEPVLGEILEPFKVHCDIENL